MLGLTRVALPEGDVPDVFTSINLCGNIAIVNSPIVCKMKQPIWCVDRETRAQFQCVQNMENWTSNSAYFHVQCNVYIPATSIYPCDEWPRQAEQVLFKRCIEQKTNDWLQPAVGNVSLFKQRSAPTWPFTRPCHALVSLMNNNSHRIWPLILSCHY